MEVNKALVELARKHDIKIIATNDVHFVNEDDAEAHDRLICLSTGKDIDDPARMRYSKQEWTIKETVLAAREFIARKRMQRFMTPKSTTAPITPTVQNFRNRFRSTGFLTKSIMLHCDLSFLFIPV